MRWMNRNTKRINNFHHLVKTRFYHFYHVVKNSFNLKLLPAHTVFWLLGVQAIPCQNDVWFLPAQQSQYHVIWNMLVGFNNSNPPKGKSVLVKWHHCVNTVSKMTCRRLLEGRFIGVWEWLQEAVREQSVMAFVKNLTLNQSLLLSSKLPSANINFILLLLYNAWWCLCLNDYYPSQGPCVAKIQYPE